MDFATPYYDHAVEAADVHGLSSMATRVLLSDLAQEMELRHGVTLHFTSAGGVEVARRIREGTDADLVVLADGAMRELADDQLLVSGTLRPLFLSQVVAAVPASLPPRDLNSVADLRAALERANRIAYSTGPSGDALLALLNRWQLAMGDRLVQAPPGVPVGSLLASGEADLGFQQHSELMDIAEITVLGPLPGEAAISSTFSGGVLAASRRPDLAEHVLDLVAEVASASWVETRGMSRAQ